MKKSMNHALLILAAALISICVAANEGKGEQSPPENYNDRFIAENARVIAFENANIIDGTGAEAKAKHTLVVKDGRIIALGPDGSVDIPNEAKRISLKGKSLTPGWVMTHEHLFYWHLPENVPPLAGIHPGWPWLEIVTQSVSYPRLHLAAGVTGARTVGTFNPYADLQIKSAINEGLFVGPDYDLSVYVPAIDLLGIPSVADTESARETVRFWVKRGFTSIKAYHIQGENLEATIDEAHKLGVKVTIETGHLLEGNREAIDFGVDQIEHMVAFAEGTFDNRVPLNSDAAIAHMQYFIDHNVPVSMTISEWDNIPAPDHVLELFNDYARKKIEESHLGPDFMTKPLIDGTWLKREQESAYAFWRQGGTITLGSDAVFGDHIAGYSNLRTVELSVDAGIPNLEVIKMATHNGADAIGILDDRGTIEIGKRADLIIMKGDPSRDIKAIYDIETVFKNGIGYDPEALIESVKGTVGGPG